MISVNNKPINVTMFPDNTSQVWKLDDSYFDSDIIVKWNYSHEGEVMHLCQLKALLDLYPGNKNLYISYLPYARQDKEISNGSCFALEIMCAILNKLNFNSITILDPHSSVPMQQLEKATAVYPHVALDNALYGLSYPLICYPDKGAFQKYSSIYSEPCAAIGEKTRDQSTGEITGMTLKTVKDLKGQEVLIVDDICDGGRTFIELAKELYKAGATAVHLFVTHGIFSKGLKVLREAGIMNIYTANGPVKNSDLQKGV